MREIIVLLLALKLYNYSCQDFDGSRSSEKENYPDGLEWDDDYTFDFSDEQAPDNHKLYGYHTLTTEKIVKKDSDEEVIEETLDIFGGHHDDTTEILEYADGESKTRKVRKSTEEMASEELSSICRRCHMAYRCKVLGKCFHCNKFCLQDQPIVGQANIANRQKLRPALISRSRQTEENRFPDHNGNYRYFTLGEIESGPKSQLLTRLLSMPPKQNYEKLIVIAPERSQDTSNTNNHVIIDTANVLDAHKNDRKFLDVSVHKPDKGKIDQVNDDLIIKINKDLDLAIKHKMEYLGDSHLTPEEIDEIIDHSLIHFNTKTENSTKMRAAELIKNRLQQNFGARSSLKDRPQLFRRVNDKSRNGDSTPGQGGFSRLEKLKEDIRNIIQRNKGRESGDEIDEEGKKTAEVDIENRDAEGGIIDEFGAPPPPPPPPFQSPFYPPVMPLLPFPAALPPPGPSAPYFEIDFPDQQLGSAPKIANYIPDLYISPPFDKSKFDKMFFDDYGDDGGAPPPPAPLPIARLPVNLDNRQQGLDHSPRVLPETRQNIHETDIKNRMPVTNRQEEVYKDTVPKEKSSFREEEIKTHSDSTSKLKPEQEDPHFEKSGDKEQQERYRNEYNKELGYRGKSNLVGSSIPENEKEVEIIRNAPGRNKVFDGQPYNVKKKQRGPLINREKSGPSRLPNRNRQRGKPKSRINPENEEDGALGASSEPRLRKNWFSKNYDKAKQWLGNEVAKLDTPQHSKNQETKPSHKEEVGANILRLNSEEDVVLPESFQNADEAADSESLESGKVFPDLSSRLGEENGTDSEAEPERVEAKFDWIEQEDEAITPHPENTLTNFGKIILENHHIPLDAIEKDKIFFIGNGIKLPLVVQKSPDGSLQLNVDVDKLCNCNDNSCKKRVSEQEEQISRELQQNYQPYNHQQDIFLGMNNPQHVPGKEDNPDNFLKKTLSYTTNYNYPPTPKPQQHDGRSDGRYPPANYHNVNGERIDLFPRNPNPANPGNFAPPPPGYSLPQPQFEEFYPSNHMNENRQLARFKKLINDTEASTNLHDVHESIPPNAKNSEVSKRSPNYVFNVNEENDDSGELVAVFNDEYLPSLNMDAPPPSPKDLEKSPLRRSRNLRYQSTGVDSKLSKLEKNMKEYYAERKKLEELYRTKNLQSLKNGESNVGERRAKLFKDVLAWMRGVAKDIDGNSPLHKLIPAKN